MLISRVSFRISNFLVVGLLLATFALGHTAPAQPLHEAVRQGDIAQVRLLLNQGADVNAKDDVGITPLHLAVFNNNIKLAEILLEKGAHVHARTPNGETPLHLAAGEGHLGMAEVLVDHDADVNAVDNLGRLPLKFATLQNHQPLAIWLLTQGAQLARDWDVEIGTRKYRLSAQAQEYLTILEQSDYKATRSVLIIEEPHFNAAAQWSLYKGLEQFFRDHLHLTSRTIFLAEGAEAGHPLSIEPLINAAPNPDEPLIRAVLRSFLIPAYVAYAWKYHQYAIPIIGTEDKQLYQASAALWPAENVFLWQLSVVARNESLAQTLIDQAQRYENPILFAGGLHLDPIAPTSYEFAKELGTTTVLEPDQLQQLRASDNLGIGDYLRWAKIGYTFMSAIAYESPDVVEKNQEWYRELFQAQQHGRYGDYINKILPYLLQEPSITVSPAPEAAAELVRAVSRTDENKQNNQSSNKDTNDEGRNPDWLEKLLKRLRNLREMDRKHTKAVREEKKGKKIIGPDGKPYDHITEVRNLRKGLRELMKDIRGALSDPKLTQEQVQTLNQMLGEVSTRLNWAEGALAE